MKIIFLWILMLAAFASFIVSVVVWAKNCTILSNEKVGAAPRWQYLVATSILIFSVTVLVADLMLSYADMGFVLGIGVGISIVLTYIEKRMKRGNENEVRIITNSLHNPVFTDGPFKGLKHHGWIDSNFFPLFPTDQLIEEGIALEEQQIPIPENTSLESQELRRLIKKGVISFWFAADKPMRLLRVDKDPRKRRKKIEERILSTVMAKAQKEFKAAKDPEKVNIIEFYCSLCSIEGGDDDYNKLFESGVREIVVEIGDIGLSPTEESMLDTLKESSMFNDQVKQTLEKRGLIDPAEYDDSEPEKRNAHGEKENARLWNKQWEEVSNNILIRLQDGKGIVKQVLEWNTEGEIPAGLILDQQGNPMITGGNP